jgi:hypothetical protein
MPLHIHAVVENAHHYDLRFRANSVKDGVATLAKLLISWSEVISIAANFRLTSKQVKGVVKLLKVFVALSLSPLIAQAQSSREWPNSSYTKISQSEKLKGKSTP